MLLLLSFVWSWDNRSIVDDWKLFLSSLFSCTNFLRFVTFLLCSNGHLQWFVKAKERYFLFTNNERP